ncbi:MAG: response regulator [Nitrospirae bacterium]|nr:response regulator [Nitrospirota bacterium]
MEETSSQILVVDDEALIREVLTRKLKESGYRIQTAENAFDALEKIRGNGFSVILSDIMMPGMDGISLLKKVRAQNPDTAVVMITALSNVNSAVESLRLGAYDYIIKPFNLEEVVISVRNALEKRRLILENREYQQFLEQKVEEQTQEIRGHLITEQQKTQELNSALHEIQITYNATLEALSVALDFRDNETEGHSQRVVQYSLALARELKLGEEDLETIERGTLLHDVGKIGVPDAILKKPAKLTPEEWVEMRKHVEHGFRMLKDIPFLKEAALIVLHHQEKFDGTGYPQGLKGEEIVIGARIFAIADTYDAMTSDRPYRKALTDDDARAEILKYSGTQFDPAVVENFFQIPKERWLKMKDEVDRLFARGRR